MSLPRLLLPLLLSLPAVATTQPWSVEQPPGIFSEVAIAVTEGTWMSLDVSPDGEQLVFDLLGDLYLLPVKGGIAEKLTSGLAWDMQPRFSPDGRHVAFTSDRGGGDNLWLIELESRKLQAVSGETLRLVNSPSWSPDGQSLAVRKHFTANRSLGAGEIWLYHRDGGSGTPLVSRDNDQKDIGEPVFSPDGRYLYYSRDVTPGDTFEYSRDPHRAGGIYAIERLDRLTGERERLIERVGGAVRPTPSPDERYLAFVGRHEGKTALYLFDLVSGRQQLLDDQLDHDLQETWAIHGLYPQMAWNPAGDTLYYWASGRLNSINLDNRSKALIPFQVDDSRTMTQALRFRQQLAPPQFEVKALRFATVSPAGDKLVFEALGSLWLKELPHGKPRRLTSNDERFELHPSWSRDGRQLLFTTWQDREQGSLRLLDIASGKETLLSSEPGKYVEPAFSPDGQSVVYRKLSGSNLLPRDWSLWSGIYLLELNGGAPQRLARSGWEPHFGGDNQRIYFTDKDDKLQALVSVDRHGQQRKVHYRSELASQLRLSPDGRQLGFVDDFSVFVTPFIEAVTPLSLDRKEPQTPVTRLSQQSGAHLSWSGDGKKLFWSLGPELFSAAVGTAPSATTSPAKGSYISMMAPTAKPASTIALVGGRIITMVDDEVIDDGVVVIKGDRITAVGPRTEISIPEGAVKFDIRGATLIPGLIDAHAHVRQGSDGIIPQQNWRNLAHLAFGVTTIHDPSNDTAMVFAASELQKAGKILAPRIFSTGTILYGAKVAGATVAIDSLADAERHVTRQKAFGAFTVKSYNLPRRDQRQQVIAAARLHNVMVVPEGGSLLQHNLTMIADGHTTIEHALPLAHLYADVHQFFSDSATAYTPTLNVAYGGISGDLYWYGHSDVANHPRLGSLVPRDELLPVARRQMLAPEEDYHHISVARAAKTLHDWGVKVNIGAHGEREGLGAHWEIWGFAQGGMEPLAALATATRNPAASLGLDEHLGSVEVGKLADLIVINGNPLTDIRATEKVRYTIIGGEILDATTLNKLLPQPQQRPPLYFETPPASKAKAGSN